MLMMSENKSKPIWVVVLVQSGVTTLVEAYTARTTATRRMRALKKDTSPNDDDIDLFEVEVNAVSE